MRMLFYLALLVAIPLVFCVFFAALIPTMLLTPINVPNENNLAPKDVQVFFGQNSAASVGSKFHRQSAELKQINVGLILPSGRRLFYAADWGLVYREDDVIDGVQFRLPKTTPDLYEAVDDLKRELIKIDPALFHRSETELKQFQTFDFEPRHVTSAGTANFGEIEKGVSLFAEIKTILVENENGLENQWVIYLRFNLEKERVRFCE